MTSPSPPLLPETYLANWPMPSEGSRPVSGVTTITGVRAVFLRMLKLLTAWDNSSVACVRAYVAVATESYGLAGSPTRSSPLPFSWRYCRWSEAVR